MPIASSALPTSSVSGAVSSAAMPIKLTCGTEVTHSTVAINNASLLLMSLFLLFYRNNYFSVLAPILSRLTQYWYSKILKIVFLYFTLISGRQVPLLKYIHFPHHKKKPQAKCPKLFCSSYYFTIPFSNPSYLAISTPFSSNFLYLRR